MDKPFNKEFLKQYQKRFKLSSTQMAEEIGIQSSTYKGWVGVRNVPIPKKYHNKLYDMFVVQKVFSKRDEIKRNNLNECFDFIGLDRI